jgi:hypothetical protein
LVTRHVDDAKPPVRERDAAPTDDPSRDLVDADRELSGTR